MQHTTALPFTLAGPTLHSGKWCELTVQPAPAHTGRQFIRRDLTLSPPLPAVADWVGSTQLSTLLEQGAVQVRTPEHLLAALVGLEIDNCEITLDQGELPILDGCALSYVAQIQRVGRVAQAGDQPVVRLLEPVSVWDGDRFVAAFPAPELRLSYGIDFPGTVMGRQWTSWVITPAIFSQELAPARTFTTLAQVEQLRARGLIQGGSLDSALVAAEDHWVGHLPHWPDEPCRHKALDLLGDLALIGAPLVAHVVAFKAGHDLHVKLAQCLRQFIQ
ncbi:UDP-3-O-acyl-N-acetylglucosamine deacetylase [Candidatus Cyanaurora vandensis]|uniref:UDP-3-O-acyl-N-acetylglucosamine deacetylase n=1 Tax=Candidatus Cyanaurora vandensis TaxID=2714958 RepID=UPI00257A9A2D|nr:UDP-3-O-acyl-N-acetylglucosamine deacetylase [Candidatus Cyanaurora vandensis]